MKAEDIKARIRAGRKMQKVEPGARYSDVAADQGESLGPLADLLGSWSSDDRGWNLIALPFRDASAPFNYRVLMNQYGEELKFDFVDENIPNRGITPDTDGDTDQLLTGLDYQQVIKQVESEDSPSSTLRSPNGKGIHHEPGLFLHVMNHRTTEDGKELKVARLATIPHGDSVLAMGTVEVVNGPPTIPGLDALPVRVNQDVVNNPYLAPYLHFEQNKFFGTVPPSTPGFPGFFSTNANAILQFASGRLGAVKKTTILHFDTKFGTGGIVNIPFVVREANATEMEATFWIMELEPENGSDEPRFVMQYSQVVFLDFFPSRDDPTKLIRWPHVSINTMVRSRS